MGAEGNVGGGAKGRDKLGAWDYQIHPTIHKIDKQQGFIV